MNTYFDEIAIAVLTFAFAVAAPLMLVGALLSA
jgi:hypothetical protein